MICKTKICEITAKTSLPFKNNRHFNRLHCMIMLGFTLPSTYLNNLYNVKSLNSCFLTRKNLGRKTLEKKDNNRSKTRWQIYSLIKLLSIKWRAYSKMYVCMYAECMYVCMYDITSPTQWSQIVLYSHEDRKLHLLRPFH